MVSDAESELELEAVTGRETVREVVAEIERVAVAERDTLLEREREEELDALRVAETLRLKLPDWLGVLDRLVDRLAVWLAVKVMLGERELLPLHEFVTECVGEDEPVLLRETLFVPDTLIVELAVRLRESLSLVVSDLVTLRLGDWVTVGLRDGDSLQVLLGLSEAVPLPLQDGVRLTLSEPERVRDILFVADLEREALPEKDSVAVHVSELDPVPLKVGVLEADKLDVLV